MIFYVWDELNGCRKDAERIETSAPQDAAGIYAQNDVDGNTDGVYADGHTICVADDRGSLWRYSVRVDYDPMYYATPLDDAKTAPRRKAKRP